MNYYQVIAAQFLTYIFEFLLFTYLNLFQVFLYLKNLASMSILKTFKIDINKSNRKIIINFEVLLHRFTLNCYQLNYYLTY